MTNFVDGQTLTAKQLNDAFAAAGSGGGGGTAQVQSDWSATTGVAAIANKPTLAAVATSGLYSDLQSKPTLAAVAVSGLYSDLQSKPTLATVATSGSFNDLTNQPALGAYRKLIAAQGTQTANVTGTSTPTTYPGVALTIPANSVPGLNGVLEIKARINVNTSASVKTVKAVLNNQDLGVTLQMAGIASADLTIRIQNKGATNVQLVTNSSTPNAAPTQTTVDMTAAQTITITCLLGTAGDTCNIGPFTVEASNV